MNAGFKLIYANKSKIVRKSFSFSLSVHQLNYLRTSKGLSRYDGDVSTPPSLNLCLCSSNSVDKLKVIKKNFYKRYLLLLFKYVKPSFKVSAKIMN